MNRLEHQIGIVLRFGIVGSSGLFAIGLMMMFAGVAVAMAGVLLKIALIVLIATPPTRVVISVIEYVRERDWLFVALTVIVLLALAGSLVAARW